MPWDIKPADKVRVFDVVMFDDDPNPYVVKSHYATPDNNWRQFAVLNFDTGAIGKFTVHNNREMYVYRRRDNA